MDVQLGQSNARARHGESTLASAFWKGLVPTPNDFGKQGKPPTHPELLDYLASQFIEDGWSIKAMHRRLMLSRTYRLAARQTLSQDSELDQSPAKLDPNNDWLSAFDRRRLDAEALRDTLLVLSAAWIYRRLELIRSHRSTPGSLRSTIHSKPSMLPIIAAYF